MRFRPPESDSASLLRRGLSAVALVATLAGVGAVTPAARATASTTEGPSLEVVGVLPRDVAVESDDHACTALAGCEMLIDQGRNLGIAMVGKDQNHKVLVVYDLARMAIAGSYRDPDADKTRIETLVIDPRRARVLWPALGPYASDRFAVTAQNPTCHRPPDVNPFTEWDEPVFHGVDYGALASGQTPVTPRPVYWADCQRTEQSQFVVRSTSYHGDSDSFHMSGAWARQDGWRDTTADNRARAALPALEPFSGPWRESHGQSLVVRQARSDAAGNLVSDWDIDLAAAGCGRRRGGSPLELPPPFAARVGNEIVAYCWDPQVWLYAPSPQGYVIRVPLAPDAHGIARPLTDPAGAPSVTDASGAITNYRFRRVPALPGEVRPVLDPVTGRLVLLSEGPINGNAAWVFDPVQERFVGVVTGGNGRQPRGNAAMGFDAGRGIAYLLTRDGILRAPIRQQPLPGGLLHPVLQNTEDTVNFASSDVVAVAPRLGRMVISVGQGMRQRYVVVEDRVVDAPPVPTPDPDALTTDIRERTGITSSSSRGRGISSGAHILVTGGVARAVEAVDPACRTELYLQGDEPSVKEYESSVFGAGACAPGQVVTPGHREVFVAATDAEVGDDTGAVARASGLAFAATDSATGADISRPGACGADAPAAAAGWGHGPELRPLPDSFTYMDGSNFDQQFGQINDGMATAWREAIAGKDTFWAEALVPVFGGVFGEEYEERCKQFYDESAKSGGPDPRTGTRGADGRGFPVKASVCGDFGENPSSDSQQGSSAVTCDAATTSATAIAVGGPLAIPDPVDPVIVVSNVRSATQTVRTDEGQVTRSLASAEGVVIGPVSVARILTVATTKARGHPGTTFSEVVRIWCGVRIEGQEAIPGCADVSALERDHRLIDRMNQALREKVHVSFPTPMTQATKRGYQAVATKDPGERAGDQTVNDDDSVTVAGLQALIYNDGTRGRSRIVVQLAGVHAESRYGIIELPSFSTGGDFNGGRNDGGGGGGDGGGPAGAPLAPSDVPTTGRLEEALGLPTSEVVYEEIFTTEVDRGAPAPRPTLLPSDGSLPERIVRMPLPLLRDAINLLVQHPREFGLLLLLWSLLAAPVYLGNRRRAFARAVVGT